MENVLDLLINFGFPITLSIFLLLSFQKTLKELTVSTDAMKDSFKEVMTKMSFQIDAQDKNLTNIAYKMEGINKIQIKLEELCNKK